ncbi:hypothetical protein CN613_27985, partial [Bacillus pseudomycoides]
PAASVAQREQCLCSGGDAEGDRQPGLPEQQLGTAGVPGRHGGGGSLDGRVRHGPDGPVERRGASGRDAPTAQREHGAFRAGRVQDPTPDGPQAHGVADGPARRERPGVRAR